MAEIKLQGTPSWAIQAAVDQFKATDNVTVEHLTLVDISEEGKGYKVTLSHPKKGSIFERFDRTFVVQ